MRPRVFPAEDLPAAAESGPQPGRFNEAAGIPRGRHADTVPGVDTAHVAASMRPRVFPAEDPGGHGDNRWGATRFNEAAGIPRGRRRARRPAR